MLTAGADEARGRYRKLLAQFETEAPERPWMATAKSFRRHGRTLELVVNGNHDPLLAELQSLGPVSVREESLSLEEIFLNTVR